MCGWHFKGRSIHIFKGYEGDLACRWQWGGGDGLHAESDWGVWRSVPLEVV